MELAMQPYLLGFCEHKAENRLTRSVLTAVARIGPNKTLFATCKHGVTQMSGIFLVDQRGAPLPEATWALIPTIEPDLDLAFVFIHHDTPQNRIRFNDNPIRGEVELSHGRNEFVGKTDTSPFSVHTAVAKPSHFRAQLGWAAESTELRYKHLKTREQIKEAQGTGSTLYPVLEMESWPGVSGSALWDQYGSIRGIVCGGDSIENRSDGIPRLVYIPASTITKQMHAVLQHPKIKTRMQADHSSTA